MYDLARSLTRSLTFLYLARFSRSWASHGDVLNSSYGQGGLLKGVLFRSDNSFPTFSAKVVPINKNPTRIFPLSVFSRQKFLIRIFRLNLSVFLMGKLSLKFSWVDSNLKSSAKPTQT
jgi:hypothetical protein